MVSIDNGERLRFVYHLAKHLTEDTDNIYKCPSCGGNVWEASIRTGTGKLPKDQIKLKCVLCGNWFIGSKEKIEKVLGNV